MTRKRRQRPQSGTPSRLMRRRRIASGSPALQAAVEAGLVTTYRAGEIARLPIHQQGEVLTQWADRALMRRDGSRLAAQVIRQELKRRTKVDLDRVAAAIKNAIALYLINWR
jgi:hypothetical protein